MIHVTIREELVQDHESIRRVNLLAFGGDSEAALVDRLRADGLVIASLVALRDDDVVGHICFSELTIHTSAGILESAALAPVSVAPNLQRCGIGMKLVQGGLEICRQKAKVAVLVLGHPAYYQRFGFSSEKATALKGPYSGAAFMALELKPGSLRLGGTVKYPPAFDLVK